MKIRRYQSEDRVKPVINKAVEDIEPKHYSQEQQRHLEEVIPDMNLDFAEKDRYTYFVAVENGEIVGVAGYQSETGTVSGIFVDPERKGSGIGSKLMDEIERDGRSEGFDEIKTLASLEAVEFYKKNGYKVTEEERQDIEGRNIGLKVMKKQL